MDKRNIDAEREAREERSPEIREILGRRPGHLLRYGTVYLIIAAALAIGIAAALSEGFRTFLFSIF